MATQSSPVPKPQYQHFVPQFLLRNWSHPFQAPKKNGRKKFQGKYSGEKVVHNVSFSADPFCMSETPVNRIFGQPDMYRDADKPTEKEQQQIELLFGNLESRTSIVFRKITKAFESSEPGIWLTRDERDLVRKFLFLLKYRGAGFYRRFNHDRAEGYNSDDRELFLEYMQKAGFKSPMSAWLHNLKTIMDLHMDAEGKWMRELPKRIYPTDAHWFITHVGASHMTICTPSDPQDEFVLTDNAYNIFEGPNSWVADQDTGEVGGAVHTPLHEFAPVSPKLMIVLRSNIFPSAEEDWNPGVREWRERTRFVVFEGVYGRNLTSLLEELPVKKARNTYTEIVNGEIRLLPGHDGHPQKNDKFFFSLFPINTELTQRINLLLLDNAYACSAVVVKSRDGLFRALEYYVSAPCSMGKVITGNDVDLRRDFLHKLAALAKSLGSEKELVWMEVAVPMMKNYAGYLQDHADRMRFLTEWTGNGGTPSLSPSKPAKASEFRQAYENLGGSPDALLDDLDQCQRMWRLRVKLDVWTQGLDEGLRQTWRDMLVEMYMDLMPRRVFLYSKLVRFHLLRGPCATPVSRREEADEVQFLVELASSCPVETIARAVRQVIDSRKLNQAMHTTALNDAWLRTKFQGKPWPDHTPRHLRDAAGLRYELVFGRPGYIRDCGIREIEQFARNQQLLMTRGQLLEHDHRFDYLMVPQGEKIEIMTRDVVRSRFGEIMQGRMSRVAEREELRDVMFDVWYPTPPPSTDDNWGGSVVLRG